MTDFWHYCTIDDDDRQSTDDDVTVVHPHTVLEPGGQWGLALDTCHNKGDDLFVGNGEYSNRVQFCPFCGTESKTRV